jgi:Predicted dehydrogenases and related proteins
MKKVKIAIIGTGSISHLHVAGYKNLDNVEVIGACDINRGGRICEKIRYT